MWIQAMLIGWDDLLSMRILIPLTAGIVAAVWPTPVIRLRESFDRRLAGRTPTISLLVSVAAAAVIWLIATSQERVLVPKLHDELSYLTQLQHLSIGRLWMPELPAAESFQSFHLLTSPVYGSIYFPGTSLMFLPTVWLGWAYWVGPFIVTAATVGVLYAVVGRWCGPSGGLLASLAMVSLLIVRQYAFMILSPVPATLLGLLLVLAYQHWQDCGLAVRSSLIPSAAMGALAGWLAITRPLDAVACCLPLLVAVVWDTRGDRKHLVRTAVIATAAAMPFLLLQLVQNIGMTGRPFQTPYSLYASKFSPGLGLALRGEASAEPEVRYPVRQLGDFHAQFIQPDVQAHSPSTAVGRLFNDRIPRTLKLGVPWAAILLIPAGLVAMRNRAWVLGMVPLSYLGLYTLFPFLLDHYILLMVPGLMLLATLGAVSLPSRGSAGAIATLAAAGVIGLLPMFGDRPDDYRLATMELNHSLPTLLEAPAVVLYRYAPGANVHEEPVYNIDTPWPLDAPVIRAHDLDPERNRTLFAAVAKANPDRQVYRVTRPTDRKQWENWESFIQPLGRVGDLAGQ